MVSNDFYIASVAKTQAKSKNATNTINGKIDETTKQGLRGDCALLSFLDSLSETEKGEQIIQNSIKPNKDQNDKIDGYNVYFKGLDKSYYVSNKEIEENDLENPMLHCKELESGQLIYEPFGSNKTIRYSEGDNDLLLLELGFEKCFQDEENQLRISNKNDVLEGMSVIEISRTYLGDEANFIFSAHSLEYELYSDYSERKEKLILEPGTQIEDISGNIVSLDDKKGYTVEYDLFDDYITLKNSKNQTYTFTIENFTNSSNLKSDIEKVFDLDFENTSAVLAMRSGATIGGPILNVGDEIKHNIDFQTKQLFLHETHGYSIRGVENDLVTLVDPHDTEEEICLHKDIVKEIVKAGMGDIYYTELE